MSDDEAIGRAREFASHPNNGDITAHEFARLALTQHAEVERLRGQLEAYRKFWDEIEDVRARMCKNALARMFHVVG